MNWLSAKARPRAWRGISSETKVSIVTSSTPMPMPAMKRHRSMPKPVVWNAMISVLAQYQSSEKVKIKRRP